MKRKSDSEYWGELTRVTGLQAKPIAKAKGIWAYRLLGLRLGRLVKVKYAVDKDSKMSLLVVLVRYHSVLANETMKEQIASDPDLAAMLEKRRSQKDVLTVGDNFALVTLPYTPRKETALQLGAKVNFFVEIIARYTKPISPERCENDEQHSSSDPPRPQLVLVNGFPRFWCKDCIAAVDVAAENNKAFYEATPNRLLRGVLIGTGVAIFGSIVWALLAVALNAINAAFAAFILMAIISVMKQFGTKITIGSILIAGVLTMGSVILGTYLSLVGYGYWKYGLEISLATLSRFWFGMWKDSELLNLSLFFGALGIVPYIVMILSKRKRELSQYFTPDVEVVDLAST